MLRIEELITSKQNALVVETAKLADRKHRRASGLFRFDGIKLAEEALRSGAPLAAVLLHEQRAQANDSFFHGRTSAISCSAAHRSA